MICLRREFCYIFSAMVEFIFEKSLVVYHSEKIVFEDIVSFFFRKVIIVVQCFLRVCLFAYFVN